jgi:hypothetical protein
MEIMKNYSMPHPSVWPDPHLACVDTTFGFGEQIDRYDVGGEYRSGTGAWAGVGNRMRFSKGVTRIGEMYLREIFGGDTPPVSFDFVPGENADDVVYCRSYPEKWYALR